MPCTISYVQVGGHNTHARPAEGRPFAGPITMVGTAQCCTVAMLQWYNGTLVQWYNGTMVQWYNGTIVQCCKVTMLQCCNGRMLQLYKHAHKPGGDEKPVKLSMSILKSGEKTAYDGRQREGMWRAFEERHRGPRRLAGRPNKM